jgi:carotenoid cleavage dioxygenase-like enzyme
MTRPFPDTLTFQGFDRPVRLEGEVFDLEVSGEIPTDLNGTFFRCGAEHQYPPRLGDDVFINGDGMLSSFTFEDGHVDFKCRFVRTDKFNAERAARRGLFGAYRNPFSDDPSVAGVERGTANTNVIWHGGKLLALKEDSHPMQIDPITLETRGRWDFYGAVKSRTVTAHPKIDPESGELFFYGSAAKGETTPDIAFYIANPQGRITREVWITPPYASMMHDFVVTREHVLFAVMPTTSNLERMKAGGPIYMWDERLPTYLGVMPRDGDAQDIRWFKGPARWMYHVMNGFSEDGKVHMSSCAGHMQSFPFFPAIDGSAYDPEKAKPRLTQWSCDLRAGTEHFEERVLNDTRSELPRIDDRVAMASHRWGFMLWTDPARAGTEPQARQRFNSIARVDASTGQIVDSYFTGDDSAPQEPVFVPRSAGAAEGDGYILAVVNRLAENRCDIAIMDAMKLRQGPVALCHLPFRHRGAIHGNWVPAKQLAGRTTHATA